MDPHVFVDPDSKYCLLPLPGKTKKNMIIFSVNENMKFNYSAPKLEYFVNLEDESGLEVKRKVSSASISPRKKRLRTEVEDNDGDVGLILSSIESKLESLTILLRQPGDRTLSKDKKTRLRELSRKALELVS